MCRQVEEAEDVSLKCYSLSFLAELVRTKNGPVPFRECTRFYEILFLITNILRRGDERLSQDESNQLGKEIDVCLQTTLTSEMSEMEETILTSEISSFWIGVVEEDNLNSLDKVPGDDCGSFSCKELHILAVLPTLYTLFPDDLCKSLYEVLSFTIKKSPGTSRLSAIFAKCERDTGDFLPALIWPEFQNSDVETPRRLQQAKGNSKRRHDADTTV